VRRLAKRAARALDDQNEAVTSVAATSAKTTTSVAAVAKATLEQSAAVEQIARATEDVRVRTRDTVAWAAQQARRSSAVAEHVEDTIAKMSLVRRTFDEQLTALEGIADSFDAPAPGGAGPS
jgi:methyl-accepting chemotaxis protein